MRSPKQKNPLILIQWIVWTFLCLCLFFLVYHESGDFLQSALIGIVYPLSYAIIIYTNAFVLVPYLFRRRQRALYLLAVLVMLAAVSLGLAEVVYVVRSAAMPETPAKAPMGKEYLNYFFTNVLIFLFSLPLRLAFDYYTIRGQQEQLKKRTTEAELNLLKAQVQPHFLFNTLNNIYFVAQRESPATAELLEKLSNIMRYFVDEGPQDRIPLTREIEFIRDYIHLEKMRMRHPLQVTMEVKGEAMGVAIPPMLMIPLVENVFKHGINKRSEENFLQLVIKIERDRVLVNVQNKVFDDLEPAPHGGNGLSNLRARLQLLYGERFTLHTEQQGGNFLAHLNIPL
jgi:hypothetical protein